MFGELRVKSRRAVVDAADWEQWVREIYGCGCIRCSAKDRPGHQPCRRIGAGSRLNRGRADVPVRFEIELELEGSVFGYAIAFEYPNGFKELRVLEEKFTVDGRPVYSRDAADVHLATAGGDKQANFKIDWHLVALPIIQQKLAKDPLAVLKQWLAQMLILHPMPSLISGDSGENTLEPKLDVSDFGAWFSGLVEFAPAAYRKIEEHLKQLMPDFKDIRNATLGKDYRSLLVQFSNDQGVLLLPFAALSDGEKCFMVCAFVLAMNDVFGSTFCFWDEPDNYLALSEVRHFVMALRRAFQTGGQFVATSHNPEAIRSFSDENTLVLFRRSHLDPTQVRPLSEIQVNGDLVGALIRGDIDP